MYTVLLIQVFAHLLAIRCYIAADTAAAAVAAAAAAAAAVAAMRPCLRLRLAA
jgi:hypothetical protein